MENMDEKLVSAAETEETVSGTEASEVLDDAQIAKETEEVKAGVHNFSTKDRYVAPTDFMVQKKLEWFQDQKLGLMMHWGTYSQLGIVESWALSDDDADWSRNCIDWETTGEQFKKEYFDLNKTFNPIRFEPEKWADMASDAGFKYLLFTTKHHDGFCMWDSQYSDYKITGEDCPFHTHKYADIVAHLFESFRNRKMGIGAYFSKADWHVDSYWSDKYDRGNFQWRGPSYNPAEYPEEWERFVQFTQNQLMELATKYGKLDILWLDAGWVCKRKGQDIRLGEVVDRIRKFQPGMLCSDRTIGGPYENYVTPEQCIPDEPLDIPWESCITMGTSFSFAYEDHYKSPREVICLLTDIVAKGGNLALNVGPQPDGRIPAGAIRTMKGMGEWLRKYGEAIYGTRVCAPYKKDNVAFTKKEDVIYALRTYPDEAYKPESRLWVPLTGTYGKITLLNNGEVLTPEYAEGGFYVNLPASECEETPIAHVLKIEK